MKQTSSRRKFIKTATSLAAIAVAGSSFNLKKTEPRLSFSTLGCPDWSFETILNFAVDNGYQGIELRGIKRELDLPKYPGFDSKENIQATRKMVAAKNLIITDLGCSAKMHFKEPVERKKNLDEAKRFIDLAGQLGCRYTRVFPNNFPKEQERSETIGLIVQALQELGDYAKAAGVIVLMETHGELIHSSDLENIMQSAAHPNVGLVWDMINMWSITKEPIAQVYPKLKKYIHHTHIKDVKFTDGEPHSVLLGTGVAPIFEAIDLLAADGYKGFYSFEWEKLWNPEIAEPEIALADYPKVMKRHFK